MPLPRKSPPPKRRRSRSHSYSPRPRSRRSRTPVKQRPRDVMRKSSRTPPKYSKGQTRMSRSPQRRSRSPYERPVSRSPGQGHWSGKPKTARRDSFSLQQRRSPGTGTKMPVARKRSYSRSPPYRKKSRSRSPDYLRDKTYSKSQHKARKSPMERGRRSISASPPRYEKTSTSASNLHMNRKSKDFGRRLSRSLSPDLHRRSKGQPHPAQGRSPSPRDDFSYNRKIPDQVQHRSKSRSSPTRKESKKSTEISAVYILETKRREKLNERFQTLEQLAQGSFDIEENITIGIHRGHHHVNLDKDVPVDYSFNPKAFRMMFKKKDYSKSIFDRDEIKAFRHDDILEDQAYVEKRTVTVKPVQRKSRPNIDRDEDDDRKYKSSHDSDRYMGQEDRRRVLDKTNRNFPPTAVTVRLDPKPDPRYESMYAKSQIQTQLPHNPNDLRYNLSRKRRGSESDTSPVDARNKIQARRGIPSQDQKQSSHKDLGDKLKNRSRLARGEDFKEKKYKRDSHSPAGQLEDRGSPGEAAEQEKLPDFKNRPGKYGLEDWKTKPEMIPKRDDYYEQHDNRDRERDDLNFWERKQRYLEDKKKGENPPRPPFRGGGRSRGYVPFRSRGGFVPRGDRGGRRPFRARGSTRSRGSYRGRVYDNNYPTRGRGGPGRSTSALGEWKHDMFDVMEHKSDNKSNETRTKTDTN